MDWPSKSQCILSILGNQQNPMNGGKKSKSQITSKTLWATPSKSHCIIKHLKPQTAKWTSEINKMHKKLDKYTKKQQESQ